MRTSGPRTLLVGAAAISTVAAMLTGAAPSAAHSHSSHVRISTWIPGLNAPRGLAFDAWGNLYVAESGLAGTGDAGLTDTGKVSKYAHGSRHAAWSTGFESLFIRRGPDRAAGRARSGGPQRARQQLPERPREAPRRQEFRQHGKGHSRRADSRFG